MASIQFDWESLWSFYENLESQENKTHIEKEVMADGWLYRQTAREQQNVLKHAPESFIKRIASGLKPEVQIAMGINPYSSQWKR